LTTYKEFKKIYRNLSAVRKFVYVMQCCYDEPMIFRPVRRDPLDVKFITYVVLFFSCVLNPANMLQGQIRWRIK